MRDVEARAIEVFGDPLREPPGILHVGAVWQDSEGHLRSLRIGPETPTSETDAFALALARARCEALVTTGRILRDEPGVTHRLPPALTAWRSRARGLELPPVSVVLTGRADLDPTHPLLAAAPRALVLTSPQRAPALRARLAGSGPDGAPVEVIARPLPSLRDTLDFLQRERGIASVCVEAGPSSTRALYADPIRIDELMLSVFAGARVPPAVRGEAFVAADRLDRHFVRAHARAREAEASGPWRFERYLRDGRVTPAGR